MYSFILKKKTVKRNQVTAFHIIAAILLIVIGFITVITPFSLNVMLTPEGSSRQNIIGFSWVNYFGYILGFIGIAILIVSMFFNKKYLQKRNNIIIRIIEIICFSLILIYCIIEKYYLPAVYAAVALIGIILAYYLENADQKEIKITVEETGVCLKSNIKESKWKWTEIEFFILKHNVITINTTEEKMYQFVIEPYNEISETINNYAAQKIKAAIPDRIKDNW